MKKEFDFKCNKLLFPAKYSSRKKLFGEKKIESRKVCILKVALETKLRRNFKCIWYCSALNSRINKVSVSGISSKAN